MKKPTINAGYVMGGYLKDIPDPHIRRFPDYGKRHVSVNVTTWAGYAPGAIHWRATINEEGNPLWDSREGVWRKAWDDTGDGGRIDSEAFLVEEQAVDWARSFLGKHYKPKKNYYVTSPDIDDEIIEKWGYSTRP
jgi:hypothetical protein